MTTAVFEQALSSSDLENESTGLLKMFSLTLPSPAGRGNPKAASSKYSTQRLLEAARKSNDQLPFKVTWRFQPLSGLKSALPPSFRCPKTARVTETCDKE